MRGAEILFVLIRMAGDAGRRESEEGAIEVDPCGP